MKRGGRAGAKARRDNKSEFMTSDRRAYVPTRIYRTNTNVPWPKYNTRTSVCYAPVARRLN